jgi:Domain of unknown function (DUF4334)/GXWXG protein
MLPIDHLAHLEPAASLAAMLKFFDGLPPVLPERMIGRWHGGEIATGHAFDGLLAPSGWHGKAFHSADSVDPLLFRGRRGRLFAGNPALMPLGLLRLAPVLAKSRAAGAAFRAIGPAFATRRPAARLRRTDYRGVVTATMIYDALPINDVFRLVDADTVLGAMDIRGYPDPFFFTLRRERGVASGDLAAPATTL